MILWCDYVDSTFEMAREQNKLIFLYIEYEGCEWCANMSSQTLLDNKVITYLNQHYISIKINKDIRVDIDKYYQKVYSVMNRKSGGYPLCIFMTPSHKPFFCGTYYSAYNDGQMGFLELLEILYNKYSTNSIGVEHNGDELLRFVFLQDVQKQQMQIDQNTINLFIQEAIKRYDSRNGGFDIAPKFAHYDTILTLLYLSSLFSHPIIEQMPLDTLKFMAQGGFYDVVDGGFFRYSIDNEWYLPQYEKLTFDNALAIECYCEAYFVSGDNLYSDIAMQIVSYLYDNMCDDGLFYLSSYSNKEYYMYSNDDIKSISYDPQKLSINHTNTIIRPQANIAHIKISLQNIRLQKNKPLINKTIISSVNASVAKGLFVASRIDDAYKMMAKDTIDKVLERFYIDDVLYHCDGVVGYLENFASVIEACVMAYKTLSDTTYLNIAKKLTNQALNKLYKNGKWYIASGVSANSSDKSIANILNSMLMYADDEYKSVVYHTIMHYSSDIVHYPFAHSGLVSVVARFMVKK